MGKIEKIKKDFMKDGGFFKGIPVQWTTMCKTCGLTEKHNRIIVLYK